MTIFSEKYSFICFENIVITAKWGSIALLKKKLFIPFKVSKILKFHFFSKSLNKNKLWLPIQKYTPFQIVEFQQHFEKYQLKSVAVNY